MAAGLFELRSFIVITGASKGLGKSIAVRFAQKFNPSSVFVLLARSRDGLELAKQEVLAQNNGLQVVVKCFDQGDINQTVFDCIFSDILKDNRLRVDDFQQAIIVHNAATLGDISKLSTQFTDGQSVRREMDVNVTGMILLNSAFFKVFTDANKSRLVVNVTADISNIQLLPSFSLYCAGKAARDVYFSVLAVEHPDVRVLTYHPGVMDTAMLEFTIARSAIPSLVKQVTDMKDNGKALTSDDSADRLLQILEKNTFENAVIVKVHDPL